MAYLLLLSFNMAIMPCVKRNNVLICILLRINYYQFHVDIMFVNKFLLCNIYCLFNVTWILTQNLILLRSVKGSVYSIFTFYYRSIVHFYWRKLESLASLTRVNTCYLSNMTWILILNLIFMMSVKKDMHSILTFISTLL